MVLAKTIPSGGLLELTVHRSVRRTQVQKHESFRDRKHSFQKVEVWDEISNGFLFRITLIALHRRSPGLLPVHGQKLECPRFKTGLMKPRCSSDMIRGSD